MDIKQLVTGDPKTGFYPITQDTITVIELNKAVMNLTNESSSEDIIAAFDNLESFQALIAEVRNPQNICSGILINETPKDKRVGKYEASIIANTDAETLYVKWVEIDKIVALTITNTDGTMSCIRNENNVEGDKTNVLILSLENDLANGQKDSPVDAKVSTALKDAITNEKACVIKSINSDILANLEQTGDNIIIVTELISKIGRAFITISTTITVNTATNVISDYQMKLLALETEGDGSKFLSNNGTYKEIPQPDLSNYLAKNNTTEFTPDADYEPATKKYVDDNTINNRRVYNYSEFLKDVNIESSPVDYEKLSKYNNSIILGVILNGMYEYSSAFIIVDKIKDKRREFIRLSVYGGGTSGYEVRYIYAVNTKGEISSIKDAKIYIFNDSDRNNLRLGISKQLDDSAGIFGDKNTEVTNEFNIYNQKILTESQYAALGEAVNTNGVLYFVTPDA